MKKSIFFLTLAALAGPLSAQNNTDLQTSAYRSSIAQEEVRKQAEMVRAQLHLLLEDFQQNQLNSPEFAQVRAAAEKMANLSDAEMLPLVQMLKEAGSLPKGSEVEGKLTSASETQKNIQLGLKSLADQLVLQMNQASMEKRLQDLVVAQTGNLRQTKDLAVTGKPANKLPRELAPVYALSASEQGNIRKEADLMLATLEKVVAALPEEKKAAFANALAEGKKFDVPSLAAKAADDMTAGRLTEAMGSEGRLLDALQAMLQRVRETKPVQERLEAMSNKLEQLANAQAQMSKSTEAADPSAQKDLREQQKKLNNEVAALKQELTGLNASAAMEAEKAAKAMEAAEQNLSGKEMKKEEKSEAAKNQEDAAAKLQAASESLRKQAEKMAAANQPQSPEQAMQDLAALNQQIQNALAQQKSLENNPGADPAAQQKLAEQTSQLQQQALNNSPQAAQNLGKAASEMANPSGNPEAPSPSQSLAQASQQVQEQMNAVQQALNEKAALQAMAAPIQSALDQTKKAGEGIKQDPKDLTQEAKDMMDAQQKLSEAQNQAGAGAPQDVPDALKDAQKALDKSVMEAAQSKGAEAGASNQKAQESMGKALDSIKGAMAAADAKAAAAAGQPGQPAPGQPGAPTPGSPSMMGGMAVDGQSGGGGYGEVQGFIGNAGGPGTQGQVVTGLKPKDRDAVASLQREKAPAEYQGMVQQYLKNLAEGSAPGHAVQ